MQLLKYIPLQLLMALVIGILTGSYIRVSLDTLFIILGSSFILLVISYVWIHKREKPSFLYNIAAFVLFIIVGFASMSFHDDLKKPNHFTTLASQKSSAQLVLKISSELKPTLYHHKYIAQVATIDNIKTHGRLLLNIKKDDVKRPIEIDDTLVISSELLEIAPPKNPYQFNYKNYLKKQHIYRQLIIDDNEFRTLKAEKRTLHGLAGTFRRNINEALVKHSLSGDELALVNALLLGQRQEMSKELIQDYSKAGALHILAVSGLHVGIIMLFLNFLFKPLKRFKNGSIIQLILIVLLLWIFAFIAGMSASVVRAVTMFTAVSIGLAIRRKNSIYMNLIISMFLLLLFNPYYAFEIGFQLSYLAVFFIVWIQPIIYDRWNPKWKLLDYFWQLFSVSLAAQIGVLPLSLYYFHQFPGLFFVANLMIIPVLGFVLGLGIVIIGLVLTNLMPPFLMSFYKSIIATMNTIISWIAEQKAFIFQEISFSMFLVIISYLSVIFIFRWAQNKTMNSLKYALVSVILLQLVFLHEKYQSVTGNEFIVFNKNRASIIGEKNQENFVVSKTTTKDISSILGDYKTGRNIKTIINNDNFPEVYQVNNQNLLVIDSSFNYHKISFKVSKVLLVNSPQINLDRLIDVLKPTLVVADASNYTSYTKLWVQTCVKRNTAFHYTAKDGAYVEKW